MRFKEYMGSLTESINLDKSLKDITKPNDVTWLFIVNDIQFRVFITDMGLEIDGKYYNSYEIVLQAKDGDKWSSTYTKSKVNAGVVGGKIISIVYDIIKTKQPQVYSLVAYNRNLIRLYDIVIGKYFKTGVFIDYTPYFKTMGNTKRYTFMKKPNDIQDIYMMENYTGEHGL